MKSRQGNFSFFLGSRIQQHRAIKNYTNIAYHSYRAGSLRLFDMCSLAGRRYDKEDRGGELWYNERKE